MRCFSLALAVVAAPAAAQAPTTAITRVTVVDVERGRLIPDQTVVILGNRIATVGPARTTTVPAGARVVPGTGKFLIPGLWDMHVHAVTEWFGEYFLSQLVAHGVTGVRDLFTTTEAVAAWRKRIGAGEFPGPRVGAFGSLVDGDPPIWGPQSVVARTPAEGRRVVDSLAAARVDFVKVYSRLDPATFAAIAERATAVGIPFAGHVPQLVTAAEAARLGQRTIEHLTQVILGCSSREDEFIAQSRLAFDSPRKWDSIGVLNRGRVGALLESQDPARCDRLADTFKSAGTYLVPTTTVLRSVAYLDDSTLAEDPRLKYIPAFLKTGWNPKTDFRFRARTAADWAAAKALHARELELIGLMYRRGVRILAGTDLANPYLYPGSSLHDELSLLVRVGMTPLDALRAATLEPARFLGAADSLGTVAAGRVADLVLLDGDPLASIEAVRRVAVVVADGRVYDAADRARIMAEAEQRAARGPR